MLTGSLDQLTHLGAPSPLVLVHIGDLLQFEFGIEDLVPLLGAVLSGCCGIATSVATNNENGTNMNNE